jgi:tRNA-dihydrouridine synthase B
VNNFWEKMKKPILCLAPMADVTDVAFRHIISKYSQIPHVTYTEFISADGLVKAPEEGRRKLLKDLEYSEIERPIVAQFFTSKPEMMVKAAALAVEMGFDGVDINMGCPDKSIEKQGAGAALIKNPKLAKEIIAAAKIGIAKTAKKLNKKIIPVSVKTRIGYNKDELEEWLPELLAENPAAIIIHARTRKEMSKVPAKWEQIKRAVEIRNEVSRLNLDTQKTLIIGNGDVTDTDDARKKCEESGADGAMLGRTVFGNPWLFTNHKPSSEERSQVLMEHVKFFEKKLGGFKNFAIMKKHFKEYLKDSNLRDLRFKLMRTKTAKEAIDLISDFRLPMD